MTATTVITEIRCPNCGKKMGEYLDGIFKGHCPRCGQPVHLDTRTLPVLTYQLDKIFRR